jgi:hypothetical protein
VRAVIRVAVIGFLAGPASAQEAFTFSWSVQDVTGTGVSNSNGIIEPGEDAMIYLQASFRPGVGGEAVWDTYGGTGLTGTVAGLGEVIFSLLGTQNLATGTWISDSPVPGFALSPIGSVQPGTNNLIGMIFGQYILPGGVPNSRNDDWFYRARWRPSDYLPRSVDFVFRNEPGPGDPSVLLDVGFRDPQGYISYRRDLWACNEPTGGFVIVPTSGTSMAIVVGQLMRRRRRLGEVRS